MAFSNSTSPPCTPSPSPRRNSARFSRRLCSRSCASSRQRPAVPNRKISPPPSKNATPPSSSILLRLGEALLHARVGRRAEIERLLIMSPGQFHGGRTPFEITYRQIGMRFGGIGLEFDRFPRLGFRRRIPGLLFV